MYYTNENTNLYDKTENKIGITETNINLVAPTGVVTANGVKDYADGEKLFYQCQEIHKLENSSRCR